MSKAAGIDGIGPRVLKQRTGSKHPWSIIYLTCVSVHIPYLMSGKYFLYIYQNLRLTSKIIAQFLYFVSSPGKVNTRQDYQHCNKTDFTATIWFHERKIIFTATTCYKHTN